MSEAYPPLSPREELTSPVDHSLQPELPSIEKREELSPISPSPIHVTEASEIPVLKNQMDPGLNAAIIGPFSQDEDESDDDDNEDQETNNDADLYEPSPTSTVEILQLDQSSLPHSAAASGVTSASVPSQPGMNSIDIGTAETTHTHTDTESSIPNGHILKPEPNEPAEEMEVANAIPNIDLQALLTKLSPVTLQQSPSEELNAMKPAPSGVVTSVSPPTRAETLPKPPTSLPMTHALPAPVTAAVDLPRALPASLPNPATFQPKPTPASPTSTDEYVDRPFTAEEEQAFERFQEDEREYVSKGQWDRFPIGSRLFIGNLPSEKVHKRDLFRIFSRHGQLAQISIKQAYGFVQFLDVEACMSALREEQGTPLRGRKMRKYPISPNYSSVTQTNYGPIDLEISKPQGKSRPLDASSTSRARRSKSPDYNLGSPRTTRNHPLPPRPPNRIDDRNYLRDRRESRDRDRDHRDRGDDYRPTRYSRERDDYRPHHRDRSRSPPPRYRSRSPSFHSEDTNLSHRAPADVPEVQIVVVDDVDRNFLWFVEKAFRDRMIRVDVFFMEARHQLEIVVRRQILEGVQAVVFLSRKMQSNGKVSMQVFNRQGGEANVRFDEYDGIEPAIACELVIRARQTHAPPRPQVHYASASLYGTPQQQTQQPAVLAQLLASVQGNPNLGSLISSLDPATLQKLLANLQQSQQLPPTASAQQPPLSSYQQQGPPDLAALLSGRSPAIPQPSQASYHVQTNTALASLMHAQQSQVQQHSNHAQSQPPLSSILETLRYSNR